MVVLGWVIAGVVVVAAILALPWVCERVIRSLVHHWRNAPSGGSAFNPLQELVQPQIRHVMEVQEQVVKADAEGGAAGDGVRKASRNVEWPSDS